MLPFSFADLRIRCRPSFVFINFPHYQPRNDIDQLDYSHPEEPSLSLNTIRELHKILPSWGRTANCRRWQEHASNRYISSYIYCSALSCYIMCQLVRCARETYQSINRIQGRIGLGKKVEESGQNKETEKRHKRRQGGERELENMGSREDINNTLELTREV